MPEVDSTVPPIESEEARRERMRELGKRGGKRSGEVRRKRAEAMPHGIAEGADGLDGPLAVLRGISQDPKAQASARVAAARAVAELSRAGGPMARPRRTEELEAMSTEDLETMRGELVLALDLPS